MKPRPTLRHAHICSSHHLLISPEVSGCNSYDARWAVLQLPAREQSKTPSTAETAAETASVTARQTPSMTCRFEGEDGKTSPVGRRLRRRLRLLFWQVGHLPGPHLGHLLAPLHHLLDLGDIHILSSESSHLRSADSTPRGMPPVPLLGPISTMFPNLRASDNETKEDSALLPFRLPTRRPCQATPPPKRPSQTLVALLSASA